MQRISDYIKTYEAVDDVVVMTRYDVRRDVIRPRGQTLQPYAYNEQLLVILCTNLIKKTGQIFFS